MNQVLDPHKRTTKVNLSVVVAVLLFFAAMAALVIHYMKNPNQPREEQNERLNAPSGSPRG
jgi:cell division protein YceG involved in septum cleavage